MIKIIIADDHAIVRKGLRQILSETSDMFVAAEASSGEEALKRISERKYDMVLLDISLTGKSGLDILRQMKREKPKLPVVMLSVHTEEQYAIRAFKAGASGYLTKESAPEELISALRKISRGGKYVTSALAEKMAFAITAIKREKLPHERLSDREYEVMCMIASGKTINQIAKKLSLSGSAVSTYRARILEKMKMSSTSDIIRYVVRHGLLVECEK
jgi:two-component system, NarL family, invasion response regulator UvrY